MKRRISLLLALVIVLGSFGTAFAAVPTTAQEKAEFLSKEGILKGNKSNELMLDKKENRQNMVVMLSRLMKQETEAKAHGVEEAAKFEDVTNKDYKSYVAWSVANKYIVGKSETLFGAKDNVTAQHYSIVLLRALGYFSAENLKLESEVGFAKAKELGLLEDLDVEAKTEITREQMSVMIYNALGTKMNGSEKTLAEFLGITMPEPDKLEVKVVSENLKEIKVELNNAKLIKDQKALANPDNYVFAAGKVVDVRVVENNVIVSLKDAMVAGRDYELRIRDIDADLNGPHTFKAEDKTRPEIVEVKELGTHGIKVVMSEPVRNVKETNFLIDGKNIAMKVEQFGREITLRPYHRESFPLGERKLTVKPLEDFAGYKTLEKDFNITIEEIKDLPKVESIDNVRHDRIVVKFNMDVYPESIDKTNVFWSEDRGRTEVEATDFNILDGNRVEYIFAGNNRLPGRAVEVTVKNVENYSLKAMEKEVITVRPELDYSRPEVIKEYVRSTGKEDLVEIVLEFNKPMNEAKVKEANKAKFDDQKKFVSIFNAKYDRHGKLVKDGKAIDIIESIKLDGNKKIVVNFTDGKIEKGQHYIVDVARFTDDSLLRNTMLDHTFNFKEGSKDTFKVDNIRHEFKDNKEILLIDVTFTNPVDRRTAENLTNYRFDFKNGVENVDLETLKGEVTVSRDGKLVTLRIDENKVSYQDRLAEITKLTVKDGIKDIDGNRLAKEVEYDFENAFVKKAKLETAITEAKDKGLEEDALVKDAYEKAKKVMADKDATQSEVDAAIKALNDAVTKATDLNAAKEEAKNEIDKAKGESKDDAVLLAAAEGKKAVDAAKTKPEIDKAVKEAKEAIEEAIDKETEKIKEEIKEVVDKLNKKYSEPQFENDSTAKYVRVAVLNDELLKEAGIKALSYEYSNSTVNDEANLKKELFMNVTFEKNGIKETIKVSAKIKPAV